MRKLSYALLVSLDGFIESKDGSLSWAVPDEELHQHFNDQEREIGLFLYGRRMYETMAAFWPTVYVNSAFPQYIIEYAQIWKDKPKLVFSQTMEQVGWNARLVRGDIATEVRKLKEQPGAEMSVGGAAIAAALMQSGLIDEYALYVHPVILGGGKPMFAALREAIDLRLVETRTFGSGVVLLRYQRVNALAE